MFNLDKAIQTWKKDLAGKSPLDDTYIYELEAALRDEVADLVSQGIREEDAFERVRTEMGDMPEIGREFSKVRRPHRRRGLSGLQRFILPPLLWNYVHIAVRKIRRQKGYSFINIAGLAVGLACCILMMLWIRDELSFDRFHENGNTIYRLISDIKIETGNILDARTPTPFATGLDLEIPEVEAVCRFRSNNSYGLRVDDTSYFDILFGITETPFLSMFTFPLLVGDPKTALDDPRSIILTESLAQKLFKGRNPMGESLATGGGRSPFTVTGIMADLPENSHLRFDCLIPAINMAEFHHVDFNSWNSMFLGAYVKLSSEASPTETARKITELLERSSGKTDTTVHLQPLKDIHLKSHFAFDQDNYAQGNLSILQTFSLAAAAILLLACINFMNLSTARSANRGKEVGLRKVTGARRSDIIRQFLGESVVLSCIALGMGVFLVWLIIPVFNGLAEKNLTILNIFDPGLILMIFCITLLTGIAAGSYPALFLSSFQPVNVIRGGWISGGRGQVFVRRLLVIFQFALTVFLVIGTLAVDRQLRFIRTKNRGIDTHQVVTILRRDQGLEEALLSNPRILSLSMSLPPGQNIRSTNSVSWEGKNPDTNIPFYPVPVDENYLETFHIGMAEGRYFYADRTVDQTEAVVINETAARAMGFDSPVGKRMTIATLNSQGSFEERTYTIIGVMKNFHQGSFHNPIEPMFFTMRGDQYPWMNLRISAENMEETLSFMEKTWKSLVPIYPFRYTFIDDTFDGFYKQERRTRSALGMFTVLALFTACLGLFGLASYITERRTKEIGIRKVVGASVGRLVLLQTREFIVWVLAANVIAWPAAYFAVGQWLRGFAFHMRPGINPAVLALAFSVTVSLLAVGYRAVRSALTNPAESLKYE